MSFLNNVIEIFRGFFMLSDARRMSIFYGILTALYLLTFGPFNWVFSAYRWTWYYCIFSVSAILLIIIWRFSEKAHVECATKMLLFLCFSWIAVIVLNGIFHEIALMFKWQYMLVNVAGMNAGIWMQENAKYAGLYLFFPVLLLLQYRLLVKMEFETIARIFAICISGSTGVIFYQGLVDTLFLNRWQPWTKQVGGLAVDPNAYALTAFLLMPVLVLGSLLEKRLLARVLMLIVAVSLLVGMIFAGNRTAAAGVILLAVLIPLIASISMSKASRRVRLSLLIVPLILVLGACILIHFLGDNFVELGLLGKRFSTTWQQIDHEGWRKLFAGKEPRGILWSTGWALLWEAPLGGWGPGGFYREYPNELYIQTGEIRSSYDSVLNHYLMIAGDLGLPSLMLNVALFLFPLVVAFYALRKMIEHRMRWIISTLLVTNAIFMGMIITVPPSYFPDVLWVWTSQLMLLLILSMRSLASNSERILSFKYQKLAYVACVALLMLAVTGTYITSFGKLGYAAKQDSNWWPFRYERNCYSVEQFEDGARRWCTRHAFLLVPIGNKKSGSITIMLSARNPDISTKPLKVFYGNKNGPASQLIISDYSWKPITLQIDIANIYEKSRPGGSAFDRFIILSLDVSRTWVPKKWGYNDDSRELGVCILLPHSQ